MPVTIQPDIIGSRFTGSNTNVQWERRYRATGITDASVPVMLDEVWQALPPFGDPAPAPFAGMTLTNKTIDQLTGYEVGTRNVVDVLRAQENFFRSQFDYADSRYNYMLSLILLKQQAGVRLDDLLVLDRHRDGASATR